MRPFIEPLSPLIEEKRGRLGAIAARASSEKILFAAARTIAREFDDHPIMAEALIEANTARMESRPAH